MRHANAARDARPYAALGSSDPFPPSSAFGVPYANALQLLFPGRPVFNVTGDGSFGFTLQELDTARRYRLPVVHVIHNNASWGVIAMGQAMAGFELGSALDGTDYAAIARAFGCHGERVERHGDLAAALHRALASGLPAVVDVRVRFEAHPQMAPFGRMGLPQAREI